MEEKIERLPSEVRAEMLKSDESLFFNVARFEQACRVAQVFAQSTMVPKHFQGNLGNCIIGLNYAARLRADPFMVFQSLYVVHGRPGIEAKLVEGGINQCNKYSEPLDYEWLDPEDKPTTRVTVLKKREGEWGCQAFTKDMKSGKKVVGPKIHWDLVKAMGWLDKPGPDGTIKSNMWRAMPEMMMVYRAASWFANKNCPEVKLGMHTVEELRDSVRDLTPTSNGWAMPEIVKPESEAIDYVAKFNDLVDAQESGYNQESLDEWMGLCLDRWNEQTKTEHTIKEFVADIIKNDQFEDFWSAYLRKYKTTSDPDKELEAKTEKKEQQEKFDPIAWMNSARATSSKENAEFFLKTFAENKTKLDKKEHRNIFCKAENCEKMLAVANTTTQKLSDDEPPPPEDPPPETVKNNNQVGRARFVQTAMQYRRKNEAVFMETLGAFGFESLTEVPHDDSEHEILKELEARIKL